MLRSVGIVDAKGLLEWSAVLARAVVGTAGASRCARETKAHRVKITLDRKALYELDGGDRRPRRKFKARIVPGALEVCVPEI